MAYTRVNWEDLPSTNTPINATNLNKMDEGIYDLDQGIYDLNAEISTKSQYGYKGERLEYSSLDAFKSDLITNKFPDGIYLVSISYSQNNFGIIVQKASNTYLSFIWFNYANNPVLHKYIRGTWSTYNL